MEEIAQSQSISTSRWSGVGYWCFLHAAGPAGAGFSFQKDGPLDMRMSQQGISAADVVNFCSQPDLTRIIGILGEERKASQISREIVRARIVRPFTTTWN